MTAIRWHDEEIARLKELWNEGVSLKRIAIDLNRSESSIRHKGALENLKSCRAISMEMQSKAASAKPETLWYEDSSHAVADLGINPLPLTGDITAVYMGDPLIGAPKPIPKTTRPGRWA